MEAKEKDVIVVHSGGLDSSLCLHLAIKKFGISKVLSLSFDYKQRTQSELKAAEKICSDWKVDHQTVSLDFYQQITNNALINTTTTIGHNDNSTANTLVVGRNGLMARIAAILADQLHAENIMLGILPYEEDGPGYRDCTRSYMDKMEEILRIDLGNDNFKILTPLASSGTFSGKRQAIQIAYEEGILPYLLENTITCYEGIPLQGCGTCSSCICKNQSLLEFSKENPDFDTLLLKH
jgi:7-cyano-7-deazaguanine synthase